MQAKRISLRPTVPISATKEALPRDQTYRVRAVSYSVRSLPLRAAGPGNDQGDRQDACEDSKRGKCVDFIGVMSQEQFYGRWSNINQ